MQKAALAALLFASINVTLGCQSNSSLSGSTDKTSDAKTKKANAKKKSECLGLLNAQDATNYPQLVTLWQYGYQSEADAKADIKKYWGWTGIIVGKNAILTVLTYTSTNSYDKNPGKIKLQFTTDNDYTPEHLSSLPEIESIIYHPSVKSVANTIASASPTAVPSAQPLIGAPTSPTDKASNPISDAMKDVVILKTPVSDLPQYFVVGEKHRSAGESVTLVGTGDRLDLILETPENGQSALATGRNVLLDKARLSQDWASLMTDETYLIGGRKVTTLGSSTDDTMPGLGDAGSALLQGNTLIGIFWTSEEGNLAKTYGKELVGHYFDVSSSFIKELIDSAIDKKAEIVKEYNQPAIQPTLQCAAKGSSTPVVK